MKKKALLLVALSTAVAGSALVGGLALSKGNFVAEPVKATAKEFVYDDTVGSEQFSDHYVAGKPAEVSVVTGISSNLETEVTLKKSTDEDYGKSFGNGGRFVRNSETISASEFLVTIGVNNLTNASVKYGCIKTEYTIATSVYAYFDFKDEDDVWHNFETGQNGDSFNYDQTLSWSKTQAYTITGIRVRVGVTGGSVYWGEPLYIKSITLNWSC